MTKVLFFTCALTLLVSCKRDIPPQISINTSLGDIELVLFIEKAPVTVTNFLAYVDSGLFEQGEFYRTVHKGNQPNNDVKIAVIQGGMGWSDSLPRLAEIEHETTKQTGIKHSDGVISMARNAPGTASSEFFICIGPQPELDFGGKRNPDGQGFAAFGKVINGMDVVRRIHRQPDTNQFFTEPIKIYKVVLTN